ncbi:uncharacterized protein ACRADG_007580 [Cochliomyia hominivorax]
MSGLIDKRKRSREDDVLCESTPLSKRINNLHLSNFEEAQYNQQLETQSHHNNNNHLQQLTKDMMTSSGVSSALKHITSYESDKNVYEPELDESQNPFYYVKNKLLHDLHLERLKRCTV